MDEKYYLKYSIFEKNHWWFKARRYILAGFMEDILLKHYASSQDINILDIGSGTGRNVKFLQKYGRVVGIDKNDLAIKLAREDGLDVRHGSLDLEKSLSDAGVSESGYEIITMFDLLEHIEDDTKAILTSIDLLKPGGIIFITVPAYPFLWGLQDEVSHHYRRYTKKNLRNNIEKAGLKTIRITYFNTFLFPAISTFRLLRRFLNVFGLAKPTVSSDFELKYWKFEKIFEHILRYERKLLARIDFPFGVSIAAIAIKS